MPALLAPAACALAALTLLAQSPRPFQATGQPGRPYEIGCRHYVIGTRELVDAHLRIFTLQGVETALAYPTRAETFVAEAGRKLILIRANVRNAERKPVRVGSFADLRVRVWERELAKSFNFHRAALPNGERVDQELKPGQGVDVVLIFSAPAQTPLVHVGFNHQHGDLSNTRWYDLRPAARKATSVFTTDGFDMGATATVAPEAPADFDGLELRVGRPRRLPDGGYAVEVGAVNRMLAPVRWGWQYATAALVNDAGESVQRYPELTDPATGKPWVADIAAGATTRFEYRFYPGKPFDPHKFQLKSAGNARTLEVPFR